MKTNRLIVANKGWAESIPQWMLDEVRSERMVNGLVSAVSKKELADWELIGDAEVVVYLFTLSSTVPMSTEYTNIYLHLSQKLMKRRGIELPEDIRKEKLSEYEESVFKILKQDLVGKRGKINHPLFDILKSLKKNGEV